MSVSLSDESKGVLKEARDLFASTHWTKGSFYTERDGKDTYCAVGGLRKAALGNPYIPRAPEDDEVVMSELEIRYLEALYAVAFQIDPGAARERVREYLRLAAEDPVNDYDWRYSLLTQLENVVVYWNDGYHRILDDVLGVLDRAAEAPLEVSLAE